MTLTLTIFQVQGIDFQCTRPGVSCFSAPGQTTKQQQQQHPLSPAYHTDTYATQLSSSTPTDNMSDAAAATPVKKVVKAKKPKVAPTHPPVATMVNDAIGALKDRKGSSLAAIKKYIAANNKVDVAKLAPFIKRYLKSAVTAGKLVQTKGTGAAGSFKLGKVEKPKKEKKAVKKPAAKKAKSPKKAAKKVKTPKKAAKKPAAKKAKSPAKKATKKPAAKKPKTPKKAAKPKAAKPKAAKPKAAKPKAKAAKK